MPSLTELLNAQSTMRNPYDNMNSSIGSVVDYYSKQAQAKQEMANQIELAKKKAMIEGQVKNQMAQEAFNQNIQRIQQNPELFMDKPKVIQYQNMNKPVGSMNPLMSNLNIEIDPQTGELTKKTVKPPTMAQETTALYASRIKQANDIFSNMEGYINKLPVVGTTFNKFAPNFMKSGDYQAYEQAQRNFLTAVLRRESGAVISPSEFAEGRAQYFPQPGDKPQVLEQKKRNRELVMQNFIASSRDAYVPYQEVDETLNANKSINSTNVDKDLDKQINSMLDQLGAE